MKRILALVLAAMMLLSMAACAASTPAAAEAASDTNTEAVTGVEDGVLTVGMECAYAPYNWTQMDDSNGAVPISNVPGAYANGYDVMIAQKICEANGWQLEIVSSAWDSLCPAVQSGTMDANIAGQSMTADRMQEVDMAGPYYYATIVCVTTKDSPYASATSIADLAGGKCTAQSGTIWYDSCLPQIENAELLAPAETAPAMIMQLQTGAVDFICTDMPTALAAVAKDDNLVILNFSGTDGDFQFATEEERQEIQFPAETTESDINTSAEWPVNEWTEGIPEPANGNVAWATEQGELYAITIENLAETDFIDWLGVLEEAGFTKTVSATEPVNQEYTSYNYIYTGNEKGISVSFAKETLVISISFHIN